MKCRHCQTALKDLVIDLGLQPPSNAYLTEADLNVDEARYPLKVFVCSQCYLVQTEDFVGAESLFDNDYAYFSSVSKTWQAHTQQYVEDIIARLGLNESSFVVELACNDGCLLKNVKAHGIPCLGVEPTNSTATAARELGLEVISDFFTETLAQEILQHKKKADLIIANNVFAHVPDINDFTLAIATLLAPNGTVTIEFPHVLNLIEFNQFDTIYHEHYSYLSLMAVKHILQSCGLHIIDVKELDTHGGSLRVYATHQSSASKVSESVLKILEKEKNFGLDDAQTYQAFNQRVLKIKQQFWQFIKDCQAKGETIAAYGAAAKGNTFLNFAGVDARQIPYVCDLAVSKQGKYLPGSHIAITHPDEIFNSKPDWIVVLPWNLIDEIRHNLREVKRWHGQFVTFIPEMKVYG